MDQGRGLIPAKYRPPITGKHLRRHALLRRLLDGLGRRLTLVVAGPGFGKTTLLADFAREAPVLAVWYQADAADGDLVRFLRHLVAAVAELLPGGLSGVRELLSSPAMPLRDPDAAVATLVGDLLTAAIEGIALCIDDWHLVPPGSGTAALLQRLVPYLPDHVHLFLAGRGRGDLPVERWRLQGWVEELTADDLRFTAAEVSALLREVHGLTPSDDAAEAAARQAEGWPAGLFLLGRSWRAGGAAPGDASLAPADTAALGAYLDSEVMAHLPPERRAFLVETAVLEELPAALCDELRAATDSSRHLAALAADGLFTYRVEPNRLVYRYHTLFREYLLQLALQERGPDFLAAQHQRAAAHLAAAGDRLGALRHLLAAGARDTAAELLEEIGESSLWGHSVTAVAAWLQQLPAGLLETRPRLLLLAADIDQWEGRLDLAAARLEQAAALLRRQRDAAGLAGAEVRLGHIYLLRGDTAAARHWMEGAIDRIPPGADSIRARCLVRLALVEWMEGRLERCEPLLKQAQVLFRHLGDRLGEAWALHNLAIDVHVARGDLRAATAAFHQVAELCAGTTSRLHCICLLNLGSNLCFTGRDAEGRGYLHRALAMAAALAFEAGRGYALAYLAWAEAAGGEYEAAIAHGREALAIEARVTEPQLRLEALAAEALLHRRRGRLAEALEAARQHLVWGQSTKNPFYLATSWAQLVIVHSARGAAVEARRALEQGRELHAACPNLHSRFLLLLAEAAFGLAFPAEASAPLADLLAVVTEQGYEGLLLAEGELAVRLLRAAVEQGACPEAARSLLARAAAGRAVPTVAAPEEAAPQARLHIRLLGGFVLELDGRQVAESAWRGNKPRDLCKLLALHLGTPLGLEQCLEALWPHLDRAAAQSNFRVTLHWLRKALDNDLVVYSEGRCALATAAARCDVAEFRQLVAAAEERWRAGDMVAAADRCERAAALYGGDLLAGDPPDDWHLTAHAELREGYLGVLSRLVVIQARAGERERAIETARRIVTLDPVREPAYRLLMRLLAGAGHQGEVARTYRLCKAALRQELGVPPSAATRALFERLTAGTA